MSCPTPKPVQDVSVALSIDVSGSMANDDIGEIPVELGKTTAKELCNLVVMPPSEFALQTCNDQAFIVQDFTTNRSKVLSAIEPITASGGNDFVEHLLNRLTGLLNIAKSGIYKRVAVLYTDAWWNALTPSELKQCKDTCSKYNIQFFAVIYSRPGAEPNGIKMSLQELADFTDGYLYDGIISSRAAKDIGLKLQQTAQGSDPCEIAWESSSYCKSENVSVYFELQYPIISYETSYTISKSNIIELIFDPYLVYFKNPEIGIEVTQKVNVSAVKSDFNISNIISSDPDFSISPNSFIVKQGESKELIVSYTPQDSNIHICTFNIENDKCDIKYYAHGGWLGRRISKPTLKLLHPNGGEVFIVGSDTVITWEGVSKEEKVKLEYSTDNGHNWSIITKEASGLIYKWKNVPAPASDQCLVRVSSGVGMQMDSIPSIIWEKSLGGSSEDVANSIIESIDGSLVVAGYTLSDDGDISENKGRYDFWVVKLNSENGSIIWEKTLGGSIDDYANSIIESSDGSLVVAGITSSDNGDVSENKGQSDFWIVKLNQVDGSIIWEKTLGGSDRDYANSIIESNDGTYVVAGQSLSRDGDVSGNKWDYDFWIVKLNSDDGSIIWERTLGGNSDEVANSIIESSDGSFVVAGYTGSYDGDVSENKGQFDIWVVKLNSENGSIIWEKSLGGSSEDVANSIIESSDGSFVVAGYSSSDDGDVSGNKGDGDFWLLRLNPVDASLIWEKTLGGRYGIDQSNSIIESSFGSLVAAGFSDSDDGDVSENKGFKDFWVVRLSAKNEILQQDISDNQFSIVEPNPQSIDIDMQKCLVNHQKDSLITNFISNIGSWKFTVDSIYFQGADASSFQLVSGIPEYSIEAGHSKSAEFRFSPNRVGMHYAEIVIITQAETLRQNIQGEGVEPRLEVVSDIIDFGIVDVGDHKDTIQAITIKNIGSSDLNITNTKHNKPNDVDFSTLSGGGAFSMAPDEEKRMDLRFTPTSKGRTSGTLEFYYDGTGSPAVVQLFGQGQKCEDNIIASFSGSDNTFSFDTVQLNTLNCKKLKLINTGYDDHLLDTIFFMSNIEFSIPQSNIPDVIMGLDSIEFDICFKSYAVGNYYDTLLFNNICGTNEIPVVAYVEPNYYEADSRCGVALELIGTKIEGKYFSEPSPNPFSEKTQISTVVNEQCDVTVSLINIFGQRVKTIKESLTPEISKEITITSEENIPDGTYLIAIECVGAMITYRVLLLR